MRYIDIHGHIDAVEYDKDREEVMRRAREAGVGIISVGVDLASSKRCVELAEKYGDVWAAVGMHPTEASDPKMDGSGIRAPFDMGAFRELAKHPKVVAIGECGLDYVHSGPEDIAYQKEVFLQQIMLANEVGKPLMLHVRNAKAVNISTLTQGSVSIDGYVSAYVEAIKILKDNAKVAANFHFFAGDLKDMNAAFDIGCSVSFTGVITFARSYDDLLRAAPIENIMTETDCPLVAPIPYRGKRNEPGFVVEVVRQIATIRGEAEGLVAAQILTNARRFFKLA